MKYDSHSFWLWDEVNKNNNNIMHTIHTSFEENKATYL